MPPDPHRLAILTDLRKAAGLTLADMARVCGLHGRQSHQTAGAWEMGRIVPEEGRRRQALLHYLWDGLGLRATPARLDEVWTVLVEEWGWEGISDREWQRLTNASRPEATDHRATAQPSPALALPHHTPFQAPPLTPHFVGRQHEIDRMTAWLLDHSSPRPVALVGMGGVGKSTLATQIAHRLQSDFPDGVLWAHMVEAEPLGIMQSWAQLYGFDFRSLADVENRAAAVRGIWNEKRVLIVLDDGRSPEHVRPLLPASPTCAVILTTRDRDLAALVNARVLDVHELAADASLALLGGILGAERVQSEQDAARAIAEIVDHLPLALEIGARLLNRSPWRSLADFATRLSDAAQRLDRLAIRDISVRAAFNVSWQALSPDLRRVFALLSLFQARSFASAALAAAADDSVDEAEEKLLELVNLSLLRMEGAQRFRQHPLLADFAREQMGVDGAALKRWADYYLNFAQTRHAEPGVIEEELDNLISVIETMHRQAEWACVHKLVAALHPVWLRQANYAHARRGYAWSIDAARHTHDERQRVQGLIRLGFVCCEQSAFQEGKTYLQEGLHAAQMQGETILAADAQFHLARIALEQGELEEADELLNDCLRVRAAAGDEIGVARALREQGMLFYRLGDYATTTRLCRQAQAVQEAHGDIPGLLGTLRLLADAAMETHRLDDALAYGRRSVNLAREEGLQAELAEAHFTMAVIQRLRRSLEDALAHCQQALTFFERFGNRSFIAFTRYEQSVILSLEDRDAEALAWAQQAHDLQAELGDAYGRITTLIQLGDLHKKRGEPMQAEILWRQGLLLAREIRYPHIQSFLTRLATLDAAI